MTNPGPEPVSTSKSTHVHIHASLACVRVHANVFTEPKRRSSAPLGAYAALLELFIPKYGREHTRREEAGNTIPAANNVLIAFEFDPTRCLDISNVSGVMKSRTDRTRHVSLPIDRAERFSSIDFRIFIIVDHN